MGVTHYHERYHYPIGDGTDLKINGEVRDASKYHQEMADLATAFNEAHPDLLTITYVYCPAEDYYLFACKDTMILEHINDVEEAFVPFMHSRGIDFY